MLQTYFAARSARPIAAFLIMGSLMGFVAGQRLGHPAIIAHHPVATHTAVAQHASGGLGTPVVRPLVQPVSATSPVAHTAAPAPAHKSDHGKQDKHGAHTDAQGSGGDGGGKGGNGAGGGAGGGGD